MPLPNPGHLEDLRASGLNDQTILQAGIYSAREYGVRDVLGYGGGPGLVFPYRPLSDGDPKFARVKLDHVQPDAEGKIRRYRSPAGCPPRLYVPRLLDLEILADAAVPIWVTEGEKKILRACQDGLVCVGFGGVWSWRGKTSPDREETGPIADLDRVNWIGRTVFICFDYDPKPTTQTNTQRAQEALAIELRRRGARPVIVRLPPGPNGAKQGLDDFLLTHTKQELLALVPVTIPVSSMPASGADVYSFLGLDYPPAETYVEGILPAHSSGFIAGPEKSGKSYYALEEALCLALGVPVAGYFGVPTRRRVYYIAEEDHPERVQRRLRALLKGHGLDADDPEVKRSLSPWFAIRPQGGVSLDKPEWIETIRAVCRDFKPDVIYLDVLRKLTALDIEKWVESGKLLEVLDSIRREFPGVLFRILHHGTKPRGRRREMAPGDLLGSANLGAWWETSLFFSRVSSDPTEGSRVRCRSKDIPDTPPFILKTHLEGPWDNPERIWLTAEPEDDSSTTARTKSRRPGKVPLAERVYTALATATTTTATEGEDGVLKETVAHDLDVSERAARDAMTELVKAGRVDQCGRVRGKSGPAAPLYRQA